MEFCLYDLDIHLAQYTSYCFMDLRLFSYWTWVVNGYLETTVVRVWKRVQFIDDLIERFCGNALIEASEPSVTAGANVDDHRALFKLRIMMAAYLVELHLSIVGV